MCEEKTQLNGNEFSAKRPHQRGQVLIEYVLMGVLAMSLIAAGSRIIREKKITQNLTQGPWEKASGMIESGIWAPPLEARQNHPNATVRMLSHDPNK